MNNINGFVTEIREDLDALKVRDWKLVKLQPWILKQGSRADAMRALIARGVPCDYQMVRSWGAGQKPNAFARIVLAIKGFSS